MKKIFILLICLVAFCSSNTFAAPVPEKIDGMTKNDFLLNRVMLPNPNIYLYGTDSNGFPILLMNFSSTIPFYAIEDNYKIFPKLGRYIPFFLKKISSLKFYSIYLTIEPSCDSLQGKNFHYKILKLQCKEVSQGIGYEDTDKLTTRVEPKYKEASGGFVQSENERKRYYASQIPIITYSGVGSNMLQIMLKRGKKFPIPAGHIDVSMVVMAIPDYSTPLTYDVLKGNCPCKYDFVKDFMDYINPCCNCNHEIRRIYFAKTYLDSRVKNYYGLDIKNNPNICLSSEVIMSNRINEVAEQSTKTNVTTNITTPMCPVNKCIDPYTGECCQACVVPKETVSADAGKNPGSTETKKPTKSKKRSKNKSASDPTICAQPQTIQLQYEQKKENNYLNQESTTITEDETLLSPVMQESEFMYNKVITEDQNLNQEPYTVKIQDIK